MSIKSSLNRRRFLGLGTLAVGAVGAKTLLDTPQKADASLLLPGQFDQRFLSRQADIKQVWDFSTFEQLQTGVVAMKNAMNAFEVSYRKTHFLVIDMRGTAIVGALNGTMWTRYNIASKYQLLDPKTGAYYTHNPFYRRLNADNGRLDYNNAKSLYQDATLQALVQRGAHLSACHDALQAQAALTVKDGRAQGRTAEEVYHDFAANLVHGTQETPSGSALIAVAQGLGFTYAKQ